jgi:hypothetical protein
LRVLFYILIGACAAWKIVKSGAGWCVVNISETMLFRYGTGWVAEGDEYVEMIRVILGKI